MQSFKYEPIEYHVEKNPKAGYKQKTHSHRYIVTICKL